MVERMVNHEHRHENLLKRTNPEVRSYCRNFPAVFTTAKGSILSDEDGRQYIDFFSAEPVR